MSEEVLLRRAVSRRLRFEVLRRDDHTCRYCGAKAPDVQLTIDHVLPVALGGKDEPSNLVTACKDCNAGKSSVAPDSPIVDNVADDALRWARAMSHAAELQAHEHQTAKNYVHQLDEFWRNWHSTFYVKGEKQEEPVFRSEGWRDSLMRFHSLGLEVERAMDAIETAMNNERIKASDTWRYFCGICWSVLNERQEIARDMLVAEPEPEVEA